MTYTLVYLLDMSAISRHKVLFVPRWSMRSEGAFFASESLSGDRARIQFVIP